MRIYYIDFIEVQFPNYWRMYRAPVIFGCETISGSKHRAARTGIFNKISSFHFCPFFLSIPGIAFKHSTTRARRSRSASIISYQTKRFNPVLVDKPEERLYFAPRSVV